MNEQTKIFIAFLLLIITLSTKAQILNADKFGRKADTSNTFSGYLNIGANISKEENIVYSIHTTGESAYLLKREGLFILAGSFKFFQNGSDDIINGGFAHLRYRHNYTKWMTPEIFSQIQYDAIKGLQERYIFGSGVRFRVFQSDKGYFFFGAGLMYEHEEWDYSATDLPSPSGIPLKVNDLIKYTSYASFNKRFSAHVNAQAIIYFQTRPDRFYDQPRLSGEVSVEFKINKYISYLVYFSGSYDSAPPVPIESFYFTNQNTLRFTF